MATIFPAGTALAEVERRASELIRGGVEEGRANTQVVDGLAQELLGRQGPGPRSGAALGCLKGKDTESLFAALALAEAVRITALDCRTASYRP